MRRKPAPIFFYKKNEEDDDNSGKKKESEANQYISNQINHYHSNSTNQMDKATIAKETVSLLKSYIQKNKSITQITSEVTEAANTSLLELWEKIKPIFIEEFEEEGTLNEDVESEPIITREIRKKITDTDEEFYIKRIKECKPTDGITIIGGKNNNVVTGEIKNRDGNLSIGGNKNSQS